MSEIINDGESNFRGGNRGAKSRRERLTVCTAAYTDWRTNERGEESKRKRKEEKIQNMDRQWSKKILSTWTWNLIKKS